MKFTLQWYSTTTVAQELELWALEEVLGSIPCRAIWEIFSKFVRLWVFWVHR